MQLEKIRDEINRLDLTDKLRLLDDIWDSIASSKSELPIPEWQKLELEKRYQEYKSGQQVLHNWEAVHEEIQNKYKLTCVTRIERRLILRWHFSGTKNREAAWDLNFWTASRRRSGRSLQRLNFTGFTNWLFTPFFPTGKILIQSPEIV